MHTGGAEAYPRLRGVKLQMYPYIRYQPVKYAHMDIFSCIGADAGLRCRDFAPVYHTTRARKGTSFLLRL